jgi:hypothetical protein
MVTIREDGTTRRVTAAEAFLLQLAKRGVEGDSAAARALLSVIEEANTNRQRAVGPLHIVWKGVAPGSVTTALEALRMAKTLDPYRETARVVLEPWLVEASLARLPRKLSSDEQRIIDKVTRTSHKVRWPEWWSENPRPSLRALRITQLVARLSRNRGFCPLL